MDGDAGRPSTPKPAKSEVRPEVRTEYQLPALRQDARPARRDNGRNPEPQLIDDDDEDDEKPPTPRWKKRLFWSAGLLAAAIILIGGLLYWLDARQYVSTDDAFIDAYISQVSSQIGGRVTNIAIADNQKVTSGQLLLELDPRDFQVKLEQARAQRAQAAAGVEQAKAALIQLQAAVDQAQANVRVSEAEFSQARSDAARYHGIDAQAVSRQSVDNANNTVKSAEAKVDANRQAVAAAQANVQAQQAQIDSALANLKAADVAVDNAQLQLSYTHIVAPRDGQIAKRTVNLGDYVSPGQSLLAVVGEDRWITANFKETQLAGMRIGSHVDIDVDACPDQALDGRVDSFQPGSGSVFSALPAENATGNYVKVVQRLPVKITINHRDAVRCQLSPGMSVTPSVKVR
jgi:membrane fusion protein (multidrug efflux system)